MRTINKYLLLYAFVSKSSLIISFFGHKCMPRTLLGIQLWVRIRHGPSPNGLTNQSVSCFKALSCVNLWHVCACVRVYACVCEQRAEANLGEVLLSFYYVRLNSGLRMIAAGWYEAVSVLQSHLSVYEKLDLVP